MPYSAPQIVGSGPNDAAMLEPDNWGSNVLNTAVSYMMGLGGYSVDRRGHQGNGDATGGASGDNSFYRDNASWMPGWGNTFGSMFGFLDPHGVPSGATAQDRATNYVGHYDPSRSATDNQIWSDVRQNLVTEETAAIAAARARGDTNIGFGDVYDAHVDAYDDAQTAARVADPTSTAANPFIDPASFALAAYAAPLGEHLGINMGPITGASIDMFNDPTDSVGDGWAKRMALSAGEMTAGGGLMLNAGANLAQGDFVDAAVSGAAGAGLMGLGAFSGVWNTATAIGNGMGVSEAVDGVSNVGGSVVDAGSQALSDAASYIGGWLP
jgi:hypothetical protein